MSIQLSRAGQQDLMKTLPVTQKEYSMTVIQFITRCVIVIDDHEASPS